MNIYAVQLSQESCFDKVRGNRTSCCLGGTHKNPTETTQTVGITPAVLFCCVCKHTCKEALLPV